MKKADVFPTLKRKFSGKTATAVIQCTTCLRGDMMIRVYYHQTDVVTVNLDRGYIVLDSGGHRSNTTKRRMNDALHALGVNASVFSRNFNMYLDVDGNIQPFMDCVEIDFEMEE